MKRGDHEAEMVLQYNKKFDTFSAIEMRAYNEKGELIKKYHKSDMYDGAAGDDATLVTDDRFLAMRHVIASYPVTIEQEYEEDISSMVDLGRWNIQHNEQSVQNAYYHITIDNNAGFRYLAKNISIKPLQSNIDNKSDYFWKVSNLRAIKLEEKAERWRVLPRIDFASNYFNFYGVPGDFSSWKSLGTG